MLGIGTILVIGKRSRRVGFLLLALLWLAGVAVAFSPLSGWVTAPLESRFPRPAHLPDHIDGILVLGGGEEEGITSSRGVAAMPVHALRLSTAAAVLRAHPEATLLFSGGEGTEVVEHPTEAEVIRSLLSDMGADMHRVRYEDRSRNTWENFVFSKAIAQPKPGQTWVLVTSALQTPRAMGIARRLSWTLIPYPTDYTSFVTPVSPSPWQAGVSMMRIDDAAHEWEGLVGYWLAGKSSALFPKPM